MMSPGEKQPLFTPSVLADIWLRNRVVMAPMTRGRATNPGLVPTDLHVEYYRQRASAGLILSEATWISRESIGFINVPGLFTPDQVEGWRKVTQAVHAQGGTIFAQIAHCGAVSHPDFLDGDLPLAPSAVNPGLRAFTEQGFKATMTPRAMTIDDIERTIDDYAAAAKNARAAGFDGVEVHGGTTFLIPEFLNSALNVRDDRYGGSAANRARFVVEIMARLANEWPDHVGLKISPTFALGGFAPTDQTVATYDVLVEELNGLRLSHLQVLRAIDDLSTSPVAVLQDTIAHYRTRYLGTLIAGVGFDKASGNRVVGDGQADLVAFGKLFIGNPDLVRRLRDDLPLNESAVDLYYQGGREGYVDYPTAA